MRDQTYEQRTNGVDRDEPGHVSAEHGIVKEGEEEVVKQANNTTGIYAILVTILLFLLVQTAGIAYWAGGISRAQDNYDRSQQSLDSRIQYLQTQNEVLAKQFAKLEGQIAADRERKGR